MDTVLHLAVSDAQRMGYHFGVLIGLLMLAFVPCWFIYSIFKYRKTKKKSWLVSGVIFGLPVLLFFGAVVYGVVQDIFQTEQDKEKFLDYAVKQKAEDAAGAQNRLESTGWMGTDRDHYDKRLEGLIEASDHLDSDAKSILSIGLKLIESLRSYTDKINVLAADITASGTYLDPASLNTVDKMLSHKAKLLEYVNLLYDQLSAIVSAPIFIEAKLKEMGYSQKSIAKLEKSIFENNRYDLFEAYNKAAIDHGSTLIKLLDLMINNPSEWAESNGVYEIYSQSILDSYNIYAEQVDIYENEMYNAQKGMVENSKKRALELQKGRN